MAQYASMFARLVANTIEDEDGCWIWQGRTNKGYPLITCRVPGRAHPVPLYAHRVMLEESTGYEFPFDEAGHWRCFKPLCIHPDCLRVETKAENLSARRGYAPCKGRWLPVLFPTAQRQADEAVDAFIDAALAHW